MVIGICSCFSDQTYYSRANNYS